MHQSCPSDCDERPRCGVCLVSPAPGVRHAKQPGRGIGRHSSRETCTQLQKGRSWSATHRHLSLSPRPHLPQQRTDRTMTLLSVVLLLLLLLVSSATSASSSPSSPSPPCPATGCYEDDIRPDCRPGQVCAQYIVSATACAWNRSSAVPEGCRPCKLPPDLRLRDPVLVGAVSPPYGLGAEKGCFGGMPCGAARATANFGHAGFGFSVALERRKYDDALCTTGG